MSEDITELQRKILALILRENRRASAIALILRHHQADVDLNKVILGLIDLEKRGLVDRITSKAWIAKGRAAEYV